MFRFQPLVILMSIFILAACNPASKLKDEEAKLCDKLSELQQQQIISETSDIYVNGQLPDICVNSNLTLASCDDPDAKRSVRISANTTLHLSTTSDSSNCQATFGSGWKVAGPNHQTWVSDDGCLNFSFGEVGQYVVTFHRYVGNENNKCLALPQVTELIIELLVTVE